MTPPPPPLALSVTPSSWYFPSHCHKLCQLCRVWAAAVENEAAGVREKLEVVSVKDRPAAPEAHPVGLFQCFSRHRVAVSQYFTPRWRRWNAAFLHWTKADVKHRLQASSSLLPSLTISWTPDSATFSTSPDLYCYFLKETCRFVSFCLFLFKQDVLDFFCNRVSARL